ncbi:MAG: transporter substrate-binding domain-containing protein [Vicingaceae bacterium]
MKLKTNILIALLVLMGQMSLIAQNSWEKTQEAKSGTLEVLYFEHEPFTYQKDGKLTGIEIDILEYFAKWVKENKGVDLKLEFIKQEGFQQMYEAVKTASINSIGAGTITISQERKRELNLTAPYLKNVSVLVSHGSIPTARTPEQFKSILGGYYATTIRSSLHEQHLKAFWEKYNITPNRDIEFVGSPIAVVKQVAESAKYYGYTDLITFWRYIKQNDQFVKMHKEANIADEYFAFAFPKNSDWTYLFNEFMESGFGFTATKDYHKILEKHLSFEVIEHVEME